MACRLAFRGFYLVPRRGLRAARPQMRRIRRSPVTAPSKDATQSPCPPERSAQSSPASASTSKIPTYSKKPLVLVTPLPSVGLKLVPPAASLPTRCYEAGEPSDSSPVAPAQDRRDLRYGKWVQNGVHSRASDVPRDISERRSRRITASSGGGWESNPPRSFRPSTGFEDRGAHQEP